MAYETYPNEVPKLTRHPIDDASHLAIGRMVRGIAELEDCLDCFITVLLSLSESQCKILLGKTGLGTKITSAAQLCALRTDDASLAFDHIFSTRTKDVIRCRNVVCHGAYLGMADNGEYFFLSDHMSLDEEKTSGRLRMGMICGTFSSMQTILTRLFRRRRTF